MINNYTAHPWHGISSGPNVPELVTAFIEIVPTDTVKYEIDKESATKIFKRIALFVWFYSENFLRTIDRRIL